MRQLQPDQEVINRPKFFQVRFFNGFSKFEKPIAVFRRRQRLPGICTSFGDNGSSLAAPDPFCSTLTKSMPPPECQWTRAAIGSGVAVGGIVVGAMYMLGGSEVTSIAALGGDDLISDGEEELSDPGASLEVGRNPVADPENSQIQEDAPLGTSSVVQPAPLDLDIREVFWASLEIRSEGEMQEGLIVFLIPEGFMLTGPLAPECKIALGEDGNARVGVREHGPYRLIVARAGELSHGEPVYSTVLQMADRGEDYQIRLDIPATRKVTIKTSREKIWLRATTAEAWSYEGFCKVVDGAALFESVPVGDIQVRLSLYHPNRNENDPPIKMIEVELESNNVFVIE